MASGGRRLRDVGGVAAAVSIGVMLDIWGGRAGRGDRLLYLPPAVALVSGHDALYHVVAEVVPVLLGARRPILLARATALDASAAAQGLLRSANLSFALCPSCHGNLTQRRGDAEELSVCVSFLSPRFSLLKSHLVVIQEGAKLGYQGVNALGVGAVGNEVEVVHQVVERLGAVAELVLDDAAVAPVFRRVGFEREGEV